MKPNQPSCFFDKRAKTKLEGEQKIGSRSAAKIFATGTQPIFGRHLIAVIHTKTSYCGHSYKVVSTTNVNLNIAFKSLKAVDLMKT